MTLLDLMDWFELTWIGVTIRESLWLFPVIESVHLLGLALLGGAVLVSDLRLLGWGFTGKSPDLMIKELNKWFLLGLVTLLSTGTALFLSEAVKCYYNEAFWAKMITLVLAIIYTLGIRNPILARRRDLNQWALGCLGLGSIMLWAFVAAAGRWIGFS
jgi:hypothetical protein